MKRTLASRAALIGLAVAIGGCTSSAKRTALPDNVPGSAFISICVYPNHKAHRQSRSEQVVS